jgi:DNA-binding XRE family transcriptional regulator
VPRKNQIPKKDRAIAARIKEFREMWKCTRPHLAVQIGVEPDVIVRVEAGRVALRYGVARKIFAYLPINPYWAATGKGLSKGYVSLPEANELNVRENALFSEVFFSLLLPSFQNKDEDFQRDMIMRYHRGKLFATMVKKAFQDVPDQHLGDLRKELDGFLADFFKKHADTDPKKLLQRRAWYANAEHFFKFPNAEQPHSEENNNLTDAESADSISANVKSPLPAFLERVKKSASSSGKKSELAKFLGAPLASVSRWLNDKREPGGEITLKMLKWVEQQERQK